MAKRKVRIVLDTNWFVSETINRKSRRTLYSILSEAQHVIFYSAELLAEYNEVIRRDSFRKYVSPQQVRKFLKLVLPRLTLIHSKSKVILSRDRKDDYILGLAKDSNADFIITSDYDLLVIKKFGKTKIVTMSEFIQLALK